MSKTIDTFIKAMEWRDGHHHTPELIAAWKEETGNTSQWKIEIERYDNCGPRNEGFEDVPDLELYDLAHTCLVCSKLVTLEMCSVERCGEPEIYMQRYE